MAVINLLQKDALGSNPTVRNIVLIYMIIKTFGWLFDLWAPCLGACIHTAVLVFGFLRLLKETYIFLIYCHSLITVNSLIWRSNDR